ncbi:MAG: ribosome maturation factor RimM [Candidatus Nanopelagicales bacterium]
MARVGKPFGVRGQVTVLVVTDEPERRFAPGSTLSFDERGDDLVEVAESARHGTRWVLRLAGNTDRDQAESLRGAELYAPATPAEAADEWFDWQLVGMACRTADGQDLGTVVAVEHAPAHDLLVVRTPDGTAVRVPFVAAMVPHVAADGIILDPPGGLFDTDEAGER